MRNSSDIRLFWLLLGLCALPLLVHYGRSGPARIMENLSLFSSQETWLRQCAGEKDAWLVPSWNGRPRVNKPPMLVWLNMLAWLDLTPETSTPDQLIARARLVAVAMALLALAATYGIARILSGPKAARLSLLVTGCGFLFIRQARMATYDTHLLGWITAAAATGIWAIFSSASAARKYAAWLLCGLLLGGALLTKGALAAVFVFIPLLAAAWLSKDGFRRHAAGLLSALAIGGGFFAAWYGHIFFNHAYAWEFVVREYHFPAATEAKPFWYYAGLLALVFPWTFWLLPALCLPLARRCRPVRKRHLLPWLWFAAIFLLMSLPNAKNQRYIVPILPATGLLLAFYLMLLDARFARLEKRPLARLLVGANTALAGVFAIGVPFVLLTQPLFAREGRWPLPGFPHLPGIPALAGGLSALVLVALFFGIRRANRAGGIVAAAQLTAALVLLGMTPVYYAYALSESNGDYLHRAEAEHVAELTRAHPLYYLSRIPDPERIIPHLLATPEDPSRGNHDRDPEKEFLLYYRGIIPPVMAGQVRERLTKQEPFFLCIRENLLHYIALDISPLEPLFTFQDGSGAGIWTLYAYLPEGPDETK